MRNPFSKRLLCTAAACLLSGMPARAETVLWDFENDADLRAWHYERRDPRTPVKELARAERFATSGSFALRFASPAWKRGMPEWPAFEGTPPVIDWSGYDRLAFDVTNVTDAGSEALSFQSVIRRFRLGAGLLAVYGPGAVQLHAGCGSLGRAQREEGEPGRHSRPALLYRAALADMEVYVDRIVLLRAQECFPRWPHAAEAVRRPQATSGRCMRQYLAKARERLRLSAAGSPETAAWVNTALADLEREVETVADRVARADTALLQDQAGLGRLQSALAGWRHWSSCDWPSPRSGRGAGQRAAERRGGRSGYFDGEKCCPVQSRLSLSLSDKVEVHLARNEKESFQVVVLPCERRLNNVRIHVHDLQATAAPVSPSPMSTPWSWAMCRPGRDLPTARRTSAGGRTDPEFPDGSGHCPGRRPGLLGPHPSPRDQTPGVYQGKLEVEIDGAVAFRLA